MWVLTKGFVAYFVSCMKNWPLLHMCVEVFFETHVPSVS